MTSKRLGLQREIHRSRKESIERAEPFQIAGTNEQVNQDRYYPLYFAGMGSLVITALVLSAANDFLFFGWLCLAAPIFLGLMAIHLAGIKQVKRN